MKTTTIKSLLPDITDGDILAATKKMEVSNAIYEQRRSLKMTQKEFAEFLGVTQGMVSKWEGFGYNFTIETLADISAKLKMELVIKLDPKWPPKKAQFHNEQTEDDFDLFYGGAV